MREAAGPIKADEAGGGRSDRARAAAAAPGEPGGTAGSARADGDGRGAALPGRGELLAAPPRYRGARGGQAAEAALSR